jgi:hypothetical protein
MRRVSRGLRRRHAAVGIRLVLAGLCLAGARSSPAAADPATTSAAPVAMFVEIGRDHLPTEIADMKTRRWTLRGLPVSLDAADETAVGLRAGRKLDLGGSFSLETTGAVRRGGPDLLPAAGENRGDLGATLRWAEAGWDMSLAPHLAAVNPEALDRPGGGLALGIARDHAAGWRLAWDTHYSRSAAGLDNGRSGGAGLALSRLPIGGAQLDLGYRVDADHPEAGAMTVEQGPSATLRAEIAASLQCRLDYRLGLAGETLLPASGAGRSDHAGAALDWDLAAQGYGDTRFTAGVSLDRDAAGIASGQGQFNLAMSF